MPCIRCDAKRIIDDSIAAVRRTQHLRVRWKDALSPQYHAAAIDKIV